MAKSPHAKLSRRERQIMDIVYKLGETSVSDVQERIEDDPGYDSIRVTLSILAKKGHLTHRRDGRRYIYSPTVSRKRASRSAARSLIETFFGGSPSEAILTMLDVSSAKLSEKELDEIAALIEREKES
jgi:predicted transcriptional regulator